MSVWSEDDSGSRLSVVLLPVDRASRFTCDKTHSFTIFRKSQAVRESRKKFHTLQHLNSNCGFSQAYDATPNHSVTEGEDKTVPPKFSRSLKTELILQNDGTLEAGFRPRRCLSRRTPAACIISLGTQRERKENNKCFSDCNQNPRLREITALIMVRCLVWKLASNYNTQSWCLNSGHYLEWGSCQSRFAIREKN